MKKFESIQYRAVSTHGTSSLYFHSIPKSVEDVRKEITESNIRAVGRGYDASAWLITKKITITYRDDNDVYAGQEVTEKVLEVFPTGYHIAL